MTRYLGRAQNLITPAKTRALVYRVQPWGLIAWTVVACAFLWFSCCGGTP